MNSESESPTAPPPPPPPPINNNGTATINISANPGDYFTMNNINPIVFSVIILILIGYGVTLSYLGDGGDVNPEDPTTLHFELLLWSVFVLLILLNGMSYIFNIDITATLADILSPTPDIIVDVDAGGPPARKSETFHIPDNVYTYENAKAVCQAYGAKLATIANVEDAYDKGADWCSYGWSENQMALFPTQPEKWEHLQTIDGHEHDCGRPGVNGGYIDNPNVRFGVNCFGEKPSITPEESQQMAETPLFPETKEEKEFDKRVDFWSKRIDDIMLAPFNSDSWNAV
jgi:hypothetical protein